MLLTFEKLAEAACLKQPAAVRRWCRRNGILYVPDSKGRPTTTVSAYEAAMGRHSATEPDWSCLDSPAN